MVDDLGYGDLSCYGQKKFKTPHIDSLATDGMKLTDHYSGSTVYAPSRCSLMTELYTGHCQVRGNEEIKPEDNLGGLLTQGSVLAMAQGQPPTVRHTSVNSASIDGDHMTTYLVLPEPAL